MKLSKQERIAAIVITILIVLVAGVFLFIKPNIETINATQVSLDAKKKEYEEADKKVKQKDSLKTQILDAYSKGKNLADMFFPELAAYEADNEFRAFLESRKSKSDHSNVLIDEITVSAPETVELSTSIFVPEQVQYALKEYVNQGTAADITSLDPNLIRQAAIKIALGEDQTIGATTVSFKLKATTVEDILKFTDEVNNYMMKDGNGEPIRKAMALGGISYVDVLSNETYEALAKSILSEAEEVGFTEFESAYHKNLRTAGNSSATTPTVTPTLPGEDEPGTTTPTTPSGTNNGLEEKIEYHYYEVPCTITFYSIERMQDPTDVLNQQDAMS